MKMKIIGPFAQIITLRNLPFKGPILDSQLEIIKDGAVAVVEGKIMVLGKFDDLLQEFKDTEVLIEEIIGEHVLVPGLIDCHTHLIYGGSRYLDFNSRLSGKSYEEIASEGGGIKSSVIQTSKTSDVHLREQTEARLWKCIRNGVTTVEIKSGYGLDLEKELRLLRLIREISGTADIEVVPTCLAAHSFPSGTWSERKEYLNHIVKDINPIILREGLCNRQDIFIEKNVFEPLTADAFVKACKLQGFQITVHADQFTVGGSAVGVKNKALSVDHLEASGIKEIERIADSDTVAVVLPGASIGLGMSFAPARKLLDSGCCMAIASDWNPGSAPMGDLLTEAGIMAIYEKLTFAEVFSGLTFRAGKALGIKDCGKIDEGMKADLTAFPVKDYKEILYHQGALKPSRVWKKGKLIFG